MSPERQLENLLHEEIPLTRALGIRATAYDGRCLVLSAPLSPNINHKSTAFGGSLYSVAVSCGWGLLHLKLAEAGLHRHIVIQESSIRYLRPVSGDMRATCCVEDAALERFMRALHKHDRARLELAVSVSHDDRPAVEFSGRYVVHG
ncbi:MAG TPA: thioesterase domain-containing protein [Gallionellaceae bacterium]|nr:thioesterase domain-containing protein [Gallionellaceae bacterium]